MLSAKKTTEQKIQSDAIVEEPPSEKQLIQEEENERSEQEARANRKPSSWRIYTMLFLIWMASLIGSGFFLFGRAARRISPISLFWQILLPFGVSTFCMYLLQDLLSIYCVDNYMDLMQEVVGWGSLCISLLFYVADVATLLSLFIIIKHNFSEMLLLFEVSDDVVSSRPFNFLVVVVICVLLLAMELYVHLEKYLKQKSINIANNSVNISDSRVDTVVALNASSTARNTQSTTLHLNKRNCVLVGLTIFYILMLFVKVIGISLHASTPQSSIASMGNLTNGTGTLENEPNGWHTMPVIVFAFSSFVLMLRMGKETQRHLSAALKKKKSANVMIVLFLPTTVIFIIMETMESCDEIYLWKELQIGKCALVILMCIIAASLRLLPCAKVCERVMCRKCDFGTKWYILLCVLMLTPAALLTLFVDCEECVIVLAGCTVWPIFIWILPCIMYFFHWKKKQEDGEDICTCMIKFKVSACCMILLGAVCFCVLHLANIGSVFSYERSDSLFDARP